MMPTPLEPTDENTAVLEIDKAAKAELRRKMMAGEPLDEFDMELLEFGTLNAGHGGDGKGGEAKIPPVASLLDGSRVHPDPAVAAAVAEARDRATKRNASDRAVPLSDLN